MFSLLVIYVAGGALLCALAVPLIRRRIPRNGLYGFRVPKTLASDDVWYPVNEFAGKRLLATGIVIIASAVLLYPVPGISIDAYALMILVVVLITLGITVVQCACYLRSWP